MLLVEKLPYLLEYLLPLKMFSIIHVFTIFTLIQVFQCHPTVYRYNNQNNLEPGKNLSNHNILYEFSETPCSDKLEINKTHIWGGGIEIDNLN